MEINLNCKRIAKYGPKFISKKKWVIFSIYRFPNAEDLMGFFEDISLAKVIPNYENIIFFSDFYDLFHFTNIVKPDTCFSKTHTLHIDLFLTNKLSCFNKTLNKTN